MLCRSRRRLGGNAQGCEGRDGRRCRRRRANETARAHGQRAAPATLSLHRTYQSRVERGTATSLPDAARVRDRGNELRARSLRKNRAPTSNVNAWPDPSRDVSCRSSRRRRDTHHTAVNDGDSLRSSQGRPLLHLLRVLRRPRGSKGHHALLRPERLSARTKQYGLRFVLFGVRRLRVAL